MINPSAFTQRQAITYRLGILGTGLMSLWMIAEVFSRNFPSLPWELLLTSGFVAVMVLLRLGADRAARVLCVLTANAIMAISALAYDRSTGGSLTFFAITGLGWIVFNRDERFSRWMSALVPAALFFICESPLRSHVALDPPMQGADWYYLANGAMTFIACYSCYAFFVTEEKRVSDRTLQRIAETNLIGVVVGRATGEIHSANDVVLNMFGFTRGEFDRGEFNLVKLTPPEYRERTRQAFEEVVATGQSRVFEKEYFTRDGGRIPVLLGIASLNHPDSSECIAFILDLSANRGLAQTSAQLEESRQVIGAWRDFVSFASHELKTPLTAISMQSELIEQLIRERGDFDPRLIKVVEGAAYSTGRMRQLIDGLLDFSRVRAGQMTIKPVEIEVAPWIGQIVDHVKAASTSIQPPIELVCEYSGSACLDPLRMAQVVSNLLSNAIKYGRGKPIGVNVARQGDVLAIRVRDEGIGIAPEDKERVFRRFERSREGAASAQGLGLGLFIAQGIVEAHGGTIEVRSQPGQGSEFEVTIPQAARA